MQVCTYCFPGCFTRPPGNLDSQPSPRDNHVEAKSPPGKLQGGVYPITRDVGRLPPFPGAGPFAESDSVIVRTTAHWARSSDWIERRSTEPFARECVLMRIRAEPCVLQQDLELRTRRLPQSRELLVCRLGRDWVAITTQRRVYRSPLFVLLVRSSCHGSHRPSRKRSGGYAQRGGASGQTCRHWCPRLHRDGQTDGLIVARMAAGRQSKAQRAPRSRAQGGKLPYGYRRRRSRSGGVEVDPEAAAKVRRAFDLVRRGASSPSGGSRAWLASDDARPSRQAAGIQACGGLEDRGPSDLERCAAGASASRTAEARVMKRLVLVASRTSLGSHGGSLRWQAGQYPCQARQRGLEVALGLVEADQPRCRSTTSFRFRAHERATAIYDGQMTEREPQGFCKYVFQDWRVNGTLAGLAVATYRLGSWRQRHVGSRVPRAALGACYLLAKYSVGRLAGWCAIAPRAEIGPRLRLPHGGAGVVINPSAVLGCDCIVYQQVTIGTDDFAEDDYWAARLGDDVFIGAGAKILGSISIGSHAVIGANAVVTHDVPPHAVAVGVPARILPGVKRKQFHPASRLTTGPPDE